jgi:hypothetical protein
VIEVPNLYAFRGRPLSSSPTGALLRIILPLTVIPLPVAVTRSPATAATGLSKGTNRPGQNQGATYRVVCGSVGGQIRTTSPALAGAASPVEIHRPRGSDAVVLIVTDGVMTAAVSQVIAVKPTIFSANHGNTNLGPERVSVVSGGRIAARAANVGSSK